MVRTASIVSAVLVTLGTAVSAAAQTPARPAGRPERNDLRTQIYVMEGALARAVMFGAQQVNREIRSVSPELFSLAGDAQARGVYLDGYGVFFDVGVPVLRQSMLWSFRFFDDERTLRDTISVLKRQLAAVRDAGERRDLELTIQSLELRLPNVPRSTDPQAKPAGGQLVTPEAAPPATPSATTGGAAAGAASASAASPEARR